MFTRIRRVWTTPRRAADRLAAAEQQQRVLVQRLDALESRLDTTVGEELPGLLLLAERRMLSIARQGTESDLHAAVEASHRHTEAAVAAALAVAKGDAHGFAESSIATARSHTDAAVAAANDAMLRASRQHVDAALAAQSDGARREAHEHAEAAADAARVTAFAAAREHAEALSHDTLDVLNRELGAVRRELRAQSGTQSAAPPSQRSVSTTDDARTRATPFDSALYVALEDRFRGDPALVAGRQRIYLPQVSALADHDHPVVDLGCGRGEWLDLLAADGVPAIGVDTNPAFVAGVGESGRQVVLEDLTTFLRQAEDGSAGAITMFQVVEHLPLAVLIDVLSQCVRVLRPGGVLIAETPNSLNLRVAATTFWLDPTHERPLHPELLQFLATHVGFAKVDGWFVNDLAPESEALAGASDLGAEHLRRLLRMVDGPGDFALLAWA